jgi:iron complex outermembrane receptor protein
MPNYTDLYYVGPNNLGNADLKPEEAVTIETGVKYNVGVVTGHVALFKRYGTNMIDWVKEQESDKWQSRNLTEINTSGIEASARIHMVQWLGSRQPLRMVNLSYGYLQLDKQSADFISKYVLDNLRHKISGDITLALVKGLLLNTRVSYQDREGSYIAYTDGSYGAETAYEPFWLCDVRLSYKRSRWEVYVEAANLLDADYFDLGNVPQPGRWLRSGVKVTVF